MTIFNINNSKIEQLNDSGDNYKFVDDGKAESTGEPVGGAAGADDEAVERMPFRPYKRFVSQSFGLVEYHSHLQKQILTSGAEENELAEIGGRKAVLASIRRHLPNFDPAEAQSAYAPAWVALKPVLVRCGLVTVDEKTTLTDIIAFLDATSVAAANENIESRKTVATSESVSVGDRRNVLVIHGRNELARNAMFEFLRAVGLNPIEWGEAVAMTAKGSPYVGEILDVAFSNAQAVVAVLTGDDLVQLRPEFQQDGDPDNEKQLTPQARPNVLFEAGMAFGSHPDRTIMVELGPLKPFSDASGRHTLRFSGSPKNRSELRDRLKTTNCAVKVGGTDWLTAGSFEEAVRLASGGSASSKRNE